MRQVCRNRGSHTLFCRYHENSHPGNPPGQFPQSSCLLVNPPSGFPPRKFPPEIFPFMFFNIPTQFFKCFYFFHYCHLYRRHYLEDCVVVLYFKSAEVKLVVAYKKIFLLAIQNGYIPKKVLLVKYDNRSLL